LPPAKAVKVAKVKEPDAETLASLATLAAGEVQTQKSDAALSAWGDEEEERVDGIPREWAEGFARLDPDRPPGDVPARRWLRFVDDVGLFLDSPFCRTAASLGWGPLDLFGCDRDRPYARIDQCGLLWLLNGSRIVAMTENTVTIERPTGAIQTYRRRPSGTGQVLPWELTVKGETPP
jgi:hypothetical protein